MSTDDYFAARASEESQPTLRDRFAMAALTGMYSRITEAYAYMDHRQWAMRAYEIADAMLAARKEAP